MTEQRSETTRERTGVAELCTQIHQMSIQLSEALEQFTSLVEGAASSGDVDDATTFRSQIEQRFQLLDKKIGETYCESLLHVNESYAFQVEMLKKNHVLQELSDGRLGLTDREGREYPIPTLEAVQQHLFEKLPTVERKAAQGFTRLGLVPYALPIEVLAEKVAHALDQPTKPLFETPTAETEGALPERHPLAMRIYGAKLRLHNLWKVDPDHKIVATPLGEVSEDEPNPTKAEILQNGGQDAGWSIVLFEEAIHLPGYMVDEEVGDRLRLSRGVAIEIYRAYLQVAQREPDRSPYAHESFINLEEYLTLMMMCVERERCLIDCRAVQDDPEAYRTIVFGSYQAETNNFPILNWDPRSSQLDISTIQNPVRQNANGVRTTVRLS
jgi:hypothetical protein